MKAQTVKEAVLFVIVVLCLAFVPGCETDDEDDDSSGGGDSPSCTSNDKLPCIENFNTCSDNCADTDLDCQCSCGTTEYNCMRSAGCTEEQAEAFSHIGICDW